MQGLFCTLKTALYQGFEYPPKPQNKNDVIADGNTRIFVHTTGSMPGTVIIIRGITGSSDVDTEEAEILDEDE